jgi:hypothetical protein
VPSCRSNECRRANEDSFRRTVDTRVALPISAPLVRHSRHTYLSGMRHEVWKEPGGGQTVCFSGPMGDDARSDLEPGSELAWTFEASSHLEAMTIYYRQLGWGEYTTLYPEEDARPYADRGWE